jgi:hypothetical protein
MGGVGTSMDPRLRGDDVLPGRPGVPLWSASSRLPVGIPLLVIPDRNDPPRRNVIPAKAGIHPIIYREFDTAMKKRNSARSRFFSSGSESVSESVSKDSGRCGLERSADERNSVGWHIVIWSEERFRCRYRPRPRFVVRGEAVAGRRRGRRYVDGSPPSRG